MCGRRTQSRLNIFHERNVIDGEYPYRSVIVSEGIEVREF